MKARCVVAVLAALFTFTACAFANDLVYLQGTLVCSLPDINTGEFCPAFAGPFAWIPDQEVKLFDPGTQTLSDVLYVHDHFFYFVSDKNGVINDPGFFVVKGLDETGNLQNVGQYLFYTQSPPPGFPELLLQVESTPDITTPEPSTILLVGPALLYLSRIRRFRRT
jgi:hypothetical protein